MLFITDIFLSLPQWIFYIHNYLWSTPWDKFETDRFLSLFFTSSPAYIIGNNAFEFACSPVCYLCVQLQSKVFSLLVISQTPAANVYEQTCLLRYTYSMLSVIGISYAVWHGSAHWCQFILCVFSLKVGKEWLLHVYWQSNNGSQHFLMIKLLILHMYLFSLTRGYSSSILPD